MHIELARGWEQHVGLATRLPKIAIAVTTAGAYALLLIAGDANMPQPSGR